jgi:hypothetical protein
MKNRAELKERYSFALSDLDDYMRRPKWARSPLRAGYMLACVEAAAVALEGAGDGSSPVRPEAVSSVIGSGPLSKG